MSPRYFYGLYYNYIVYVHIWIFFHAPSNVLETYYFDLSLLLYILIHSFKYALTPPPTFLPEGGYNKVEVLYPPWVKAVS